MTIASRTPEGSPGECPVCGAPLVVDVSERIGDVPCPSCGCLLWYLCVEKTFWLFDPQRVDADVLDSLKSSLREEADSLEFVEAVMEFEEFLGEQ